MITLILSILHRLERIVAKHDPKRIYQTRRAREAVDMAYHAPPDRLQAFTAAYYDYTNLRPDETCLVEYYDEDTGKWIWYFAPRQEMEVDE